MKVYVRKIDDQCVTHQISFRKIVWEEFFNEATEFTAVGVTSGYSEKVRVLPSTDLRFDAGLNHVIKKEGELEVGDILVIYKEKSKYDVELLKSNNPKYNSIKELCKRDERHTLLEIESDTLKEENRKEQFRNWLLEQKSLTENTIDIYVRYIDYIKDKGFTNYDLYSISDISIVVDLIDKFKTDEKYIEYNNSNNRTPLAALLKYEIFLNTIINNLKANEENGEKVTGAFNKIYYGVPGSGKSYYVNKNFNEKDFKVIRTTFHPEYTNADFIGQIMPKLHHLNDEKSIVSYDFSEGAFTKALKYALVHRSEKVVLIIEEINRGNASAIFGEIFQLLDRDDNGDSKFPINHETLIDYLNSDEKYKFSLEKIIIPSNLWIIGTMNTSDQNVFTLDTAFKRRWKMEYIPNVFENDDEYSNSLRNAKIPRTDITWERFVTEVNKKIANDDNTINSEDKQLGMYFVTLKEVQNEKEFAEKVLSYLWNDVARINLEDWFGNIKTYDELLSSYEKESVRVFNKLFENYQIHIEENNDEQSDESDTI